MDEHRIKGRGIEAGEEIYGGAEVGDASGVGAKRQWGGGSGEVSGSSSDVVSLEEVFGGGGQRGFAGSSSEEEPGGEAIGGGEPEAQRGVGITESGVDAFKKRDELGLSGRVLGSRLTAYQREGVRRAVEEYLGQGIPIGDTLAALGIPRSSYYRWVRKCSVAEERKVSSLRETELRPEEVGAIVEAKQREPWLSHRQISGRLRERGVWVSESSCYRVLKAEGWVEGRRFRERPWGEARYEPYRPNQIWGLDWTGLRIEGLRWYLLTVIDFFSRYLLAWAIVKTVTQREVTALVTLAVLDQRLDERAEGGKPWLRMDRGSPNTTSVTKEVVRELGMILSYGRVDRPTDNGRQERFYRTIKQEEIYTVLDYPSYPSARASIGDYITYYNQKRPNQALWNLTPAEVHRVGNKTLLRKYLEEMKEKAKLERKNYWSQWNQSISNKHLLSKNLS